MAWPCISRVCCLARFWNQLDKSDLAVPLTIHNYSDIEEPAEGGDGAEQDAAAAWRSGGGAPQQQRRIPTGGRRSSPRSPRAHAHCRAAAPASIPTLRQDRLDGGTKRAKKKAAAAAGSSSSSHHRKEPFAAETQYRQDFRAWPVQKRDALPWIAACRRLEPPAAPCSQGKTLGGSRRGAVYVLPSAGQEAGSSSSSKYSGFKQIWCSSPPGVHKTTSYRHEYRPWTGTKRPRLTKTKQGFIIPEDHFVQESSYKTDFKLPEAKNKFSPNPSAVFQAPSSILNA